MLKCCVALCLLLAGLAEAGEVRPEVLADVWQDKDEYGRNVWDLQRYQQKIYLGGGSTLTNAGPMTITAYDPVGGVLVNETVAGGELIYQEGIDLYRVFDGTLYLPAADPREPRNDDRSKYYRRRDGLWREYRSDESLETAHIRDLYRYNDGHIVAVGNSRGIEPDANFRPGAVYSDDDGATFSAAIDKADVVDRSGVLFSLFTYQEILFATSTYFSRAPALDALGVYVYDRAAKRLRRDPAYSNLTFLPAEEGYDERIILQPWLPLVYGGALIYPVKARLAYALDNGLIEVEQFRQPAGMYVKASLETPPRAVQFPDSAAVGEDVIDYQGEVYALANRRDGPGTFRVYLYRSSAPTEPTSWREVLYFDAGNPAKSFELLDGYAYFGLGREADDELNNAGRLLRAPLPFGPPPDPLFDDGFED